MEQSGQLLEERVLGNVHLKGNRIFVIVYIKKKNKQTDKEKTEPLAYQFSNGQLHSIQGLKSKVEGAC